VDTKEIDIMNVINVEIKAYCNDPNFVRDQLKSLGADFEGTDHQIDTYFITNRGRLKLREGNIENNLIYYYRDDQVGPKVSDCIICTTDKNTGLKEILSKALGLLVVVDKIREIYYIENIKIHIDQVKDIGNFVEIEATDREGEFEEKELHAQCSELMNKFRIREVDLIPLSYSDMIQQASNGKQQSI